MDRIVECVPNFSEGRRAEVIDAIVEAIRSVGNVYLLGREMDADHNRAVITIAGSPESIGEALFAVLKRPHGASISPSIEGSIHELEPLTLFRSYRSAVCRSPSV